MPGTFRVPLIYDRLCEAALPYAGNIHLDTVISHRWACIVSVTDLSKFLCGSRFTVRGSLWSKAPSQGGLLMRFDSG